MNKWTILGNAPSKKRGYVLAQCECGTVSERPKWNIINNHSRSCGCDTRRLQKAPRKFGPSDTDPLIRYAYRIYMGIKTRCKAKSGHKGKYYGGRGISICDRWNSSFENFLEDMGKPPSFEYSIDRENSNGNYTPENCRWATDRIQSLNRSNARIFEIDGVKKNLSEWAKETGIRASAILARIARGWPEALAIKTPALSHDQRNGPRNRIQFTHLIESKGSASCPRKAPTS